MTLATVGADGRPSTRVVLIKGFDARGIVWYTNYQSRKGRELALHPVAALQFHWVELERVVRIEGAIEKVSEAESDAYFATRPLDSRIGAWASPQSEVIASRADPARQRGALRRPVRAQAAASAALGRLSPAARCLGILAGTQVPPARSPALPARGGRAGCASGSRPRAPTPRSRLAGPVVEILVAPRHAREVRPAARARHMPFANRHT